MALVSPWLMSNFTMFGNYFFSQKKYVNGRSNFIAAFSIRDESGSARGFDEENFVPVREVISQCAAQEQF